MKLATYEFRGWRSVGAVVGKQLFDVVKGSLLIPSERHRCGSRVSQLPSSVREILSLGPPGIERVAELVERIEECRNESDARADALVLDLDEVVLLPPVPNPSKVIGVGLNYAKHAKETNSPVPDVPMLFPMFENCLVGPYQPIVLPDVSEKIDYEGELAIVVGKTAKAVSAEHAYDHVAGYMVMNDVSARDYQWMTSQFTAGKIFDTFAPCGPWLTLADEIPDPHGLDLETRIGPDVLQLESTGDMIFKVPELIEFISSFCTLEPGDVIASGTPSGVGASRHPPRWIREGNEVEVSITQLGTLCNPAVRAERSHRQAC